MAPKDTHLQGMLPLLFTTGMPLALARDAHVVAVNPAFEAMLGYTLAELRGRHVFVTHVAPHRTAPPYLTVQHVLTLQHKDGTIVPKTITRFPLIVGDAVFHLAAFTAP